MDITGAMIGLAVGSVICFVVALQLPQRLATVPAVLGVLGLLALLALVSTQLDSIGGEDKHTDA